MQAIMVVYMDITDPSWIKSYFAEVPKILAAYGAVSIAGSRRISRIEGTMKAPERMAIFSFPSLDAIDAFMNDENYKPFREARVQGSKSEIFVFENAVAGSALV
jgi:uncharacterized protein (DUF1330 family)